MRTFLDWLTRAESVVAALAYLIVTGLLLGEIIAREVFGTSIWGSQKMAVFAAIFAAFLGLSALYFWSMMHAWKILRLFGRSICRRRNARDRRSAWNPRGAAANLIKCGPNRRAGSSRRHSADFVAALLANPGSFGEPDTETTAMLRKCQ